MPTQTAVVIPIYQSTLSDAERFSVANAVTVLARHDVYLIGPERLGAWLNTYAQTLGRPVAVCLFADHYFVNIEGYNRLMLSKRLYQAFTGHEYILIAQTDSLVFKDDLERWASAGYSYVGAPWFEGYTKPVQPLKLTSVGNGGFSLRSIPDFLRVLHRPRVYKNILMQNWPGSWMSNTYRFLKDYHSLCFNDVQLNVKVNEDLFWGLFVEPQCSFFKVPTPVVALDFAFEAHPDHLFELNQQRLPFGCHAWQRYRPDFWVQTLGPKWFSRLETKLLIDQSSTHN